MNICSSGNKADENLGETVLATELGPKRRMMTLQSTYLNTDTGQGMC